MPSSFEPTTDATEATVSDGIAVAHGGGGDLYVTSNISISLEAFQAFAREHDISDGVATDLIRIVESNNLPIEDAEAKLLEIASRYVQAKADFSSFHRLDANAETGSLKANATKAFNEGRLGDAEALLRRVESLARENANSASKAYQQAKHIEAQAAALRANVRFIQLDYQGAAEALQAAIASLPEHLAVVGKYQIRLAEAERYCGRFELAVAAAEAALSQTRTLDSLFAAKAWRERALSLREAGNYELAQLAMDEALKNLVGVGEFKAWIVELLVDSARLLLDRGKVSEAQAVFDELAKVEVLPATASGLVVARLAHGLGRLHIELGDWISAEAALDKALSIQREIRATDHPHILRIMIDLAYVLRRAGRRNDAIVMYESACNGFERVFGRFHPEFVTVLDHLGGLFAELGELHRARETYEQAISLGEHALGPFHHDLGQSWNNLGVVLQDLGVLEEAKDAFAKAVEVFREALGEEHPEYATALHNSASALLQMERLAEATDFLSTAQRIRETSFGPDHVSVADGLLLGAVLHLRDSKPDQALAEHARAMKIVEKVYGPSHERTIRALAELARIHIARKDWRSARNAASKALFAARRSPIADPALIALSLNNLGHADLLSGRIDRALRVFAWGLKFRREAHPSCHPEVATALANLAAAYEAAGQQCKAADYYIETVEHCRRLWPDGSVLSMVASERLAHLT